MTGNATEGEGNKGKITLRGAVFIGISSMVEAGTGKSERIRARQLTQKQ